MHQLGLFLIPTGPWMVLNLEEGESFVGVDLEDVLDEILRLGGQYVGQVVSSMTNAVKHLVDIDTGKGEIGGEEAVENDPRTPDVHFLARIALSGDLLR